MPELTESAASAREIVERFLHAALAPAENNLADLYAPEVVIEMPFAPPSYPRRAETGREELRARFVAGAGARHYQKVGSVVVYETSDPEVIIVEYDLHGKVVATGDPFVLSYIMVMTIRDGLIVHSRDYTDPIASAQALGMLPRLFELLTAQET
jgi:ketosteroid isomerase-like protein